MAGRQRILDDMRQAFEDGIGNPNLSTILIGARGTGKTALMSCIRDEALGEGWIAVGATALPGMLEDLYEQTSSAASHLTKVEARHSLTSLSVGPVSAGWKSEQAPAAGNWRTRMTRLLASGVIGERGRGICGFDIPGFRDYVVSRQRERTEGGIL